jgi:hypothetical protein
VLVAVHYGFFNGINIRYNMDMAHLPATSETLMLMAPGELAWLSEVLPSPVSQEVHY